MPDAKKQAMVSPQLLFLMRTFISSILKLLHSTNIRDCNCHLKAEPRFYKLTQLGLSEFGLQQKSSYLQKGRAIIFRGLAVFCVPH